MKKFLTIGDIHGKNTWKNLGDIDLLIKSNGSFDPDYNFYVFIGDYTDAFDKTSEQIYNNLVDIIEFKKLYPNNVILLLGNHDNQYYLTNPLVDIKGDYKYYCSGFRFNMHIDLHELYNKNKDLFQLSFQYKNYIWTHAGIHKGWFMTFEKEFDKLEKEYNFNFKGNLSDKLNISFYYKLDCLFDVGYLRGGNKQVGGPFWVDKKLLYKKPLINYNQIVGHTHVDDITTYKKDKNTSITFVDVLDNKNKSYNLEIDD